MDVRGMKKKIAGHWVTNDFMGMYEEGDTLGRGDTITFTKAKYDDKLYHWGGGVMSGVQFKGDSGFTQFQNVNCSDETDTRIAGGDERYFFLSDSVVEVRSILREFKFRILKVDSKTLSIKILR